MIDPAPRPPLPVHLECVSWQLVQHHLLHGALRFADELRSHLGEPSPSEPPTYFCLATEAGNPIDVVALLRYRLSGDDLYIDCIQVQEACRRRGIARQILTEVVTHPTCMHVARLHWTAVADGDSDAAFMIRHLAWLRANVRRLCGTPFELLVAPSGSSVRLS